MTYKQLYKHYKSVKAIAEALGTDTRNVGNWPRRGVPKWAQAKAERLTNGKLKAKQNGR